ncbi:hypothetical protein HK097_004323 [Rhizophlyctis rosea]|uniref:Uncharacterized protein n=1 Tax=Rhizophlyctis rosea TaxID=64517 RepID=A0AAD5WWT1_9FUNG|nr:hypothetical protein HK097_004323 [Rhizophlyctis rosea]
MTESNSRLDNSNKQFIVIKTNFDLSSAFILNKTKNARPNVYLLTRQSNTRENRFNQISNGNSHHDQPSASRFDPAQHLKGKGAQGLSHDIQWERVSCLQKRAVSGEDLIVWKPMRSVEVNIIRRVENLESKMAETLDMGRETYLAPGMMGFMGAHDDFEARAGGQ